VSLQHRKELVDHAVHNINDLMEKWDQRLTLQNLRLRSRFLSGDIDFIIRCMAKESVEVWVCSLSPEVALESDSFKQNVLPDRDNGLVFIDIANLVQSPECIIPTLVRFERINKPHRVGAHSLYFSAFGFFVCLGVGCDWESRMLRGSAPVGFDKLPCEVIQGTPKIVHDVPGDGKQLKGTNGVSSCIGQASGKGKFSVTVTDDNCVVSVSEGFRDSVKLLEILFGPFDLNLRKY
jgi:hypothetical protein